MTIMAWHLILGSLIVLAVLWLCAIAEDAENDQMQAADKLDLSDPRVDTWVESY